MVDKKEVDDLLNYLGFSIYLSNDTGLYTYSKYVHDVVWVYVDVDINTGAFTISSPIYGIFTLSSPKCGSILFTGHFNRYYGQMLDCIEAMYGEKRLS